jgi:hypothetical protein
MHGVNIFMQHANASSRLTLEPGQSSRRAKFSFIFTPSLADVESQAKAEVSAALVFNIPTQLSLLV